MNIFGVNFRSQNLKKQDRTKRLFQWRGWVSDERGQILRWEVVSGFALKLELIHGNMDDSESMLIIGALFFTAYLTLNLPESWFFRRKSVASWDGNREFFLIDGRVYGFYVYESTIVWNWHRKIHEYKSTDPWWMSFSIHFDELLFGRRETLIDEMTSIDNIKFKMGGKDFLMNSIKWKKYRTFRRFIPYALYHKTWFGVEMKIDNPPMYAGKGENSWDCDDNGTYGTSRAWPHDRPTWKNREALARIAVGMYVDGVLKDAHRYGGSSAERGINRDAVLEYIGPIPFDDPQLQAVTQ